ncbi:hypothetical protein PG988_004411 [Apiospora saccharicola]
MRLLNRQPDGTLSLTADLVDAARDGLEYFWVDACCIDKSNSTELQEAINSMFRWYQSSSLFPSVEFFSKKGKLLGDKQSLGELLQQVTRVPTRALNGATLSEFGEVERMS